MRTLAPCPEMKLIRFMKRIFNHMPWGSLKTEAHWFHFQDFIALWSAFAGHTMCTLACSKGATPHACCLVEIGQTKLPPPHGMPWECGVDVSIVVGQQGLYVSFVRRVSLKYLVTPSVGIYFVCLLVCWLACFQPSKQINLFEQCMPITTGNVFPRFVFSTKITFPICWVNVFHSTGSCVLW